MRYNIYNSRQKNYAMMGKAMNNRKKNNVVHFEVDKIVTHKVKKTKGIVSLGNLLISQIFGALPPS